MKPLFIYHHLGLGDHIICNAIVRHFAKERPGVMVICKEHNLPSVQFMYRDLLTVSVQGTPNEDAGAEGFARLAEANGWDVLRLGANGKGRWNHKEFDRCFYEQAGLPFELRWDGFHVEPNRELGWELLPPNAYCFIHEDKERGYTINLDRTGRVSRYYPNKAARPVIFDWWNAISKADEIHCIDSSFACFADSIQTKARRKCIHRYARPGITEWPTYKNNWEILT